MARKNYSEEFRRQAVYESTPGATIRSIASDLGVVRGTLTDWVDKYGTGRNTAADGTAVASPVGTSADNSLAESFNAALKREVLCDDATWPDEMTCRRRVLRWVARYNTRRRHSWCGQQCPDAFEAVNTITLTPAA